ncbi:MAG: glycosyltransferase family 9 protein [Planctomycetota bacterium]
MDDPGRILVVRLSHLGDVVQTVPLVHALAERFPDAEIGFAVQREFAGVVRGLRAVSRVVEFDRRGGLRAWFDLRRELRAFRPDLAIDAQANTKSAFVARASGAPVRLAPARAEWREPAASRLANRFAPPLPPDRVHAQERVLRLAAHLCGDFDPRRDLDLTDDELDRGRATLHGLAPTDAPVVVVQVGDERDVRTPPRGTVRAIVRDLVDAGAQVVVTCGGDDVESARAVVQGAAERVALRPGPEAPRELAAWFAACAERGGAFVSADTGPMHLAAAHGLACVCLSGPFDHRRTGPWPSADAVDSPHRVVRADPPPECSPCFARTCHLPGGRVCMERIAADDAVAAALAVASRGWNHGAHEAHEAPPPAADHP